MVHHDSPQFDLDGKTGVNCRRSASLRFARVPFGLCTVYSVCTVSVQFLYEFITVCGGTTTDNMWINNGGITDGHDATKVQYSA